MKSIFNIKEMTDLKKFMMSRMELILYQGIQNYLDQVDSELEKRLKLTMTQSA